LHDAIVGRAFSTAATVPWIATPLTIREQDRKRPAPTAVSCIIERRDGCVLICTDQSLDSDDRAWEFPTGLIRQDESPEAGARRVASERVAINIDIHTGQPPVEGQYHDADVVFRFFLAHVNSGNGQPLGYQHLRWVRAAQLCEYEFSPAFQPVANWYAE